MSETLSATPTAITADPITPRHNGGLDALRASTTLLVLFHHTALTYGAIGGWFFREIPTDRSPSAMLLILFGTVNQAWFMGLFFLLAGYFTPAALRDKGPLRFMADRLLRLGLPLLVFGWLLGPITIALALTDKGRPFFGTLLWLWRHGVFEKGPLWFAWALLIPATVAALWQAVQARRGGRSTAASAPRPFPANATLLIAALATGVAAFALRVVWPVGQEAWGLQLGYCASYVVLFAAGCLAAGPRWPRSMRSGSRCSRGV
jgi:hypothetical protein